MSYEQDISGVKKEEVLSAIRHQNLARRMLNLTTVGVGGWGDNSRAIWEMVDDTLPGKAYEGHKYFDEECIRYLRRALPLSRSYLTAIPDKISLVRPVGETSQVYIEATKAVSVFALNRAGILLDSADSTYSVTAATYAASCYEEGEIRNTKDRFAHDLLSDTNVNSLTGVEHIHGQVTYDRDSILEWWTRFDEELEALKSSDNS